MANSNPASITSAPRNVSASKTSQLSLLIQKTKDKGRRRQWQDIAILTGLVGDTVFFMLGMFVAYYIRFYSRLEHYLYHYEHHVIPSYNNYFVFGLILFVMINILNGSYRPETIMRLREIQWRLVRSVLLWFGCFLLLAITFKMDPSLSQAYVWLCVICSGILLTGWRWTQQKIYSIDSIAMVLRQRILVIGWNNETIRLAKAIWTDANHPYSIVGCIRPPQGTYSTPPPGWVEQLGDYNQLEAVVGNGKIDIVLVADLDALTNDMVALSEICERHMVQYKIIPSYFQILLSGLVLESVSGIPVLGVERLPLRVIENRFLKRTVDIIGACVGLILFAPLFVWFGIQIKMESPGPVIYSQTRFGRHGRPFRIYKLRSMHLGGDNPQKFTEEDDPRVLKVGKFLRQHNIDEMPQFWNVLRGEMSLVGPRPERPSHAQRLETAIPHYTARQHIKPGLTGWAQIHGLRGNTDLNERVRYDLYYIENWTLWLDFYIMAMTVVRNKNAY